MKKATYAQPTLNVFQIAVEDIVRTSNNPIAASGDAVFVGYTAEEWN